MKVPAVLFPDLAVVDEAEDGHKLQGLLQGGLINVESIPAHIHRSDRFIGQMILQRLKHGEHGGDGVTDIRGFFGRTDVTGRVFGRGPHLLGNALPILEHFVGHPMDFLPGEVDPGLIRKQEIKARFRKLIHVQLHGSTLYQERVRKYMLPHPQQAVYFWCAAMMSLMCWT